MNENCAIYQTADFIGKRWTILILLELYKGKNDWKRYSKLKENLGDITPKIFSMRLKELEKNKLIQKRIDVAQFPIKSEYSLTESGQDFIKVIKNMKVWSLKWRKNKICARRDCKDCNF